MRVAIHNSKAPTTVDGQGMAFAIAFPVCAKGFLTAVSRKHSPEFIDDVMSRRGRVSFRAFPKKASSAPGHQSVLRRSKLSMEIKVGDRVRIIGEDIIMYHLPGHKEEPIDMYGRTGVVTRDVSVMKDGFKTSATSPYLVLLDDFRKGSAHFAEHELEVISSDT